MVLWPNPITYDTCGSSALLTQGMYVFIDSLVPHLWLPVAVCQRFEKAFNLTWDVQTELCLLHERVYSALVQQNPTFTLSLDISEDRKDGISITIPYAAFDLNLGAPVVNNTFRYFPLKRAANESQFILGRVFLQEAYVVADYDRRNFTISQVAFLHDSDASQVVDIVSPSDASNSTAGSPVDNHAANKLSSGALAGIAVGGIVLLAGAMFLLDLLTTYG